MRLMTLPTARPRLGGARAKDWDGSVEGLLPSLLMAEAAAPERAARVVSALLLPSLLLLPLLLSSKKVRGVVEKG